MNLAEFHATLPELDEKNRLRVDGRVSDLHEIITKNIQQEAPVFADTLLRWFAKETGAIQAVFWEADSQGSKLSFAAGFACTAHSLQTKDLELDADSPYQVVIKEHEVIYHRALEGVYQRSATFAIPLRSWLVLPILINGKLRAVIEFFHNTDFEKEGLHLLWQSLLPIAAAWSGVIEQQSRKILIDALQEQTERLHQQNEVIRAKGEELQQQAEELAAINDNLEKTHQRLADKIDELAANKQSIERKNQSIMASIQYAQRIQQAMLPSQQLMKNLLQEQFLYFSPRDVVSGDFYWVSQSEQGVWVVVADCTGHGVPAALLGMMGINLLEHITQTQRQLTPAQLLTYLSARVKETLRQEETENQDGMDMSICLLDWANQIIHFSGAMNSAYYFSEKGIKKLPNDRLTIGGKKRITAKGRQFTNHQAPMLGGGMLYLSSDGFQDQFGGPENRKFMRKNYLALLEKLWKLPVEVQQQRLALAFQAWKGDQPQTDDVSILGIRL